MSVEEMTKGWPQWKQEVFRQIKADEAYSNSHPDNSDHSDTCKEKRYLKAMRRAGGEG